MPFEIARLLASDTFPLILRILLLLGSPERRSRSRSDGFGELDVVRLSSFVAIVAPVVELVFCRREWYRHLDVVASASACCPWVCWLCDHAAW